MGVSFDYTLNIDGFFQKVLAKAQSKINAAVDEALTELFQSLKSDLLDIYQEVIADYYSDYSPSFYGRKGSLYNLIEFSESPDEIRWDFDPSAATSMRSGGTVYDLAFLHGYHGGATGTDKRGESRGFMSYRTPFPGNFIKTSGDSNYNEKVFMNGYTRWGRAAAKSESPYEQWETKRREFISAEARSRFVELLQKHISNIQWF